ncbi:uncharacterized protein LOC110039362 [Phalaenopsis equestris]|nr:uncharacterized protein LOC110039362 [Phalaenopsis equestris]
MPPHSSLPALKILNHSLTSSQIPSGHLSHGNSMFHHASTFLLGQGTFGAKEQWMSHPGDADQGYSDAWNQGGRPSSSLSVPFVQDGHCRLTTTDFYHPQHYSAPSRASLPGDSFANFTPTDFWRPT